MNVHAVASGSLVRPGCGVTFASASRGIVIVVDTPATSCEVMSMPIGKVVSSAGKQS